MGIAAKFFLIIFVDIISSLDMKAMKHKIIIYQVLPRLYGNKSNTCIPHGTLAENGCGKMADFTSEVLQEINELGATHIWYTGLIEHATQTDYSAYGIAQDTPAIVKGKAGSPYAIKDYYDVDPDLATDISKRRDEVKQLIKRTHAAGLKVVIDFVPNHLAREYRSDVPGTRATPFGAKDNTQLSFSPNNNFYYIDQEPLYTSAFDPTGSYHEQPAKATGNDRFDRWPSYNDWYETIKLNYGVDYQGGGITHFDPIPDTWHKMLHILIYWAKRGVDAFRCDMAEMVPCAFWHWAIAEIKRLFPNIIFIAEVYTPSLYRDYIYHGGFDYLYDKVGMYDTLRGVICGYTPAAAITQAWQQVDDIKQHMLHFLENHDEQRIASDFFASSPLAGRPALVVSACLGSSPFMLYAGQEWGESGMDEEGYSGCDGRTTIFDYWTIDTLYRARYTPDRLTPSEKELQRFYQQVLQLCHVEKALSQGVMFDLMYANYQNTTGMDTNKHFAFLRAAEGEAILIVANFSTDACTCGINIPQHAFDYLAIPEGSYEAIELLTATAHQLTLTTQQPPTLSIPAQSAIMLKFLYTPYNCS